MADDDFVRMAELGLGSPTGSVGASSNWYSDAGVCAASAGVADLDFKAGKSGGDTTRLAFGAGTTAPETAAFQGNAADTPTDSLLQVSNDNRLSLLETPDVDSYQDKAMLSGDINPSATGPGASRASGRESPPIVVPTSLPAPVDNQRASVQLVARAELEMEDSGTSAVPIDGNSSLELIYDHVLNAYYDPATGHYYELAT